MAVLNCLIVYLAKVPSFPSIYYWYVLSKSHSTVLSSVDRVFILGSVNLFIVMLFAMDEDVLLLWAS